jgi:DNA mismatch repair ATPase MutS
MEVETATENFSLLYPPGVYSDQPNFFLEPEPDARRDLGMAHIISAFTPDREHQKEIQKLFSRLPRDPEVISYRQDVLEDLIANPELIERLASLLPVIDSLARYSYPAQQEVSALHEVTWRVGELQNILVSVEGLGSIFQSVGNNLHSQGLHILREEIRKIQDSPTYQSLVKELPELLSKLRGCASITIGVNLDASLHPVQATLLEVSDKPFTDQSLLNRLFGIKNDREGIAPLHSVPQRVVEGQYAFPINSELGWAVEPMMVPLFADLAKVLERTTQPIAKQLKQYADIQSLLYINLRQGLIFYLGAIRFIQRLQKLGLPMCRPQIALPEDRLCKVKESYNVNLVLDTSRKSVEPGQAIITRNDIVMDQDGQILILTGPNQGGKTTYMQGTGIVQVLAQVGCYVPGTEARISPIDHLLTHFQLEEKPEKDTGRLGEEAIRLGKIFERVTRLSLVLLNESLSSTSFNESLYLAQDIVRILRRVGARAIYSTHLHELANQVDELNSSVPGDSKILSVVSSPVDADSQAIKEQVEYTYKVEMRPPLGQSYAREIAARYGISYEQLEKLLTERGVL